MIKKFEKFNNDKILYLFDLDNTLVKSPSFNDLAIQYLKEDVTIETLLNKSLNIIGAKLGNLKYQDNKIYIFDPDKNFKEIGNWVRKGKRLYLTTPNKFNTADISLPTSVTSIIDIYNSIENKCIVTARDESIRRKIVKKLKEFGIDIPKYGLHMAPTGTKNLGNWKSEKIVEILKNNKQFDSAVFYDDNRKFISSARRIVKEKLPDIKFKAIKIIL